MVRLEFMLEFDEDVMVIKVVHDLTVNYMLHEFSDNTVSEIGM